MSGRLSTVSIKAASSTVRVIGPRCATVPKGDSGQAGTRPKVGFSPTMPQKLAGMRIEPPPSVPTCSAPIPSAAATAAPPLEPPGVRGDVPGVAGDVAQRVVGDALPAELGRGRAAEQHRPRLAQPCRRRRVGRGRRMALGGVAAAARGPAAGQDQVLDRRGHTVEQAQGLATPPARLRFPSRRQRGLAVDQAEGVDPVVPALDPVQAGLGRLDRRQLLAPVEPQQRGGARGWRDRWLPSGLARAGRFAPGRRRLALTRRLTLPC